jgi:predicted metal-dependent peptidase
MKIAFLLDKSGSMHPQSDDAIGSFNAFIKDQDPEIELSLFTFSNDMKQVFGYTPAKDVKPITTEDYHPGGGTALYDAMGEVLKGLVAGDKLIVLTDGEENSSSKYTKAHIKDLIQLTGVDVVYAGADIEDANDMGIQTTIHYNGTNTPDIMTTLSQEARCGTRNRSF